MEFYAKLIELRKTKGLSQEELANRLGVTRQTVSKWESGQTTPEMSKLIELSSFFSISLDELTGTEKHSRPQQQAAPCPRAFHYEYKSGRTLFGLPLVHINVGPGMRKACGIVAVGNIARGVVSVGALSCGVVSVGALSAGAVTLGAASLGLISAGGLAAGVLAAGGVAVGLFSVGGVAVGKYAIGGLAYAKDIAMGGYAKGHIAIGDIARGDFAWQNASKLTPADYAKIKTTILQEYPGLWKCVLNAFT